MPGLREGMLARTLEKKGCREVGWLSHNRRKGWFFSVLIKRDPFVNLQSPSGVAWNEGGIAVAMQHIVDSPVASNKYDSRINNFALFPDKDYSIRYEGAKVCLFARNE